MAKTVIIGAGVAGLSAGIYLRLAGQEAVIYEKHTAAGGNLTGWRRGEKSEYYIDNCIHWLTGTNPNTKTYKMWEQLGALGQGVGLAPCSTLYTCRYGERSLSLTEDLYRLESDMYRISPDDAHEIRDFVHAVKVMQGMSGIGGEGHDEKLGVWETVRSLPLIRKYALLSARDLSERFRDPLLQKFMTSFIGGSFSSLALVAVFAHFTAGNGGVPKGGSVAMAERMASRFTALGGELVLGKEAVRIKCEKNTAKSVIFSDGSEVACDHVIVTADPAAVFGNLIKRPMPSAISKKYRQKRGRVRFSCWQTAFSCDCPELPFKGDLALPLGEEYSRALRASFITLREFSHDSFAPDGKCILQTMVFCTEKECRRFIALSSDRAAYEKEKSELSRSVSSLIEENFPELLGKLECLDVWTPATYKRYTGSEIGSFMAFLLPKRTLPARIPTNCGIKNLILASQWSVSPGGLPIAAGAGKRAAEAIAKKEKRRLRLPRIEEAPAPV